MVRYIDYRALIHNFNYISSDVKGKVLKYEEQQK